MARSAKQNANLRRGGISGDARTAARAREARIAHEAEDERVGELARDDLAAALEEIAAVMPRHLVTLHRRAARAGGEPSRALVDASREFRQTLEAVAEARAARGPGDQAKAFFDELDARIAAIRERIGDARPPIEPAG